MRTFSLSVIFLLAAFCGWGQARLPEYDSYIDTYKQFAIDSRERFGIPAAITMAQGILESGAGTSDLATECNNHFGIKCGSSWYGKTMSKDDDSAGECFRCYTSAQASFDDHSEFLKRQRYAFLFDYQLTDYGSWAQGLRQAGYATDPAYPQKLIALIETYELYLLDGGENLGLTEKPTSTVAKPSASKTEPTTPAPGTSDQSRKTAVTTTPTAAPSVEKKTQEQVSQKAPEVTANNVKEPKKDVITDKTIPYEITENNGVKCIRLMGDATFKRISKLIGLSVERLLYLNDLPQPIALHSGDLVYLSWKKSQADKSLPVYTVKSGDSMYSISQEFGIRLSSLYKLNDMEYGTPARVGQQLNLHR
ncbi:MAG: glucosaminidase domain-containing protein [Paludibacteraceae bacterium]|nr:glucosaminidase domain-containing protein [Paludibacteraceae bacterium]